MYTSSIVTHQIEGREIFLHQISDFDKVLDDLVNKDPGHIDVLDERIPYWMDLWPSALALARYLIRHKELFFHKSIIEIGAGLALPSIAIAPFCKEITITDYLEDALKYARENCQLNQIRNAKFLHLDWRKMDDDKKYDIVLASDIAYEKRFFGEIPIAINSLLADDGTCYFAEPGRIQSKKFMDEILPGHFHSKHLGEERIQLNKSNAQVNIFELKKIFKTSQSE